VDVQEDRKGRIGGNSFQPPPDEGKERIEGCWPRKPIGKFTINTREGGEIEKEKGGLGERDRRARL